TFFPGILKQVQKQLRVHNETFSLQNMCTWKVTAVRSTSIRSNEAGRRRLWSLSLLRVSESTCVLF
ncbi:uncharacterized, partial [Tachysurus ichikawai]